MVKNKDRLGITAAIHLLCQVLVYKEGGGVNGLCISQIPAHHHRQRHDSSSLLTSFDSSSTSNNVITSNSTSTSTNVIPKNVSQWGSARFKSIVKPFTLSQRELYINIIQFALLKLASCLLRIPNGIFQAFVLKSNMLGLFPETSINHYHYMSVASWSTHIITQMYGIGIILKLIDTRTNNHKAVAVQAQAQVQVQQEAQKNLKTKRRRISFGIIIAMQQLMGWLLMLSHTLIGSDASMFIAEKRLFNVATSLMKISVFSSGFVICSPIWGWLSLIPIVAGVMMDVLNFGNVYGIVINIFGMMVMLASSNDAFPMIFKASYTFLPIGTGIVSLMLDKFGFSASSDLRHSAVTALLACLMILMNRSLDLQNKKQGR
mmetsp:Transcript_11129/g.12900  ORF Transcript_11129/g.12900 Transcript_11129/m.12900 type:complete len:375 (+) Transcript_11129:279-1403(+)